jgi:hypothetical protein
MFFPLKISGKKKDQSWMKIFGMDFFWRVLGVFGWFIYIILGVLV